MSSAADFNRHLTSVDNDLDWLNKFIIFNSTNTHKIYHMKNIKDLTKFGSDKKWGFALVDHKLGEKRYRNIIDLAHKATIVAAHDAEVIHDHGYGYVRNKALDHYKYICKMSMWHTGNHKDLYTSTLIMSNFIDITFLEDVFKRIKYKWEVVACEYKNM